MFWSSLRPHSSSPSRTTSSSGLRIARRQTVSGRRDLSGIARTVLLDTGQAVVVGTLLLGHRAARSDRDTVQSLVNNAAACGQRTTRALHQRTCSCGSNRSSGCVLLLLLLLLLLCWRRWLRRRFLLLLLWRRWLRIRWCFYNRRGLWRRWGLLCGGFVCWRWRCCAPGETWRIRFCGLNTLPRWPLALCRLAVDTDDATVQQRGGVYLAVVARREHGVRGKQRRNGLCIGAMSGHAKRNERTNGVVPNNGIFCNRLFYETT